MKNLFAAACLLFSLIACADNKELTQNPINSPENTNADQPFVQFETSLGNFTIALRPDKAPVTVTNFLSYVDSGFYSDTIFHRVINGFMVQGGGFTADLQKKATQPPIKIEADNGLLNTVGSVAMARTGIPDSATSQFFINVVDNHYLNHRAKNPMGWGYTVFGQVVDGMDTVEKIKAVPTGMNKGMQNVPVEAVIIKRASRLASTGTPDD